MGLEIRKEHCLTGQSSRIPCLHNGTGRKTVSEDFEDTKVLKVPRTVGFKLGLHFLYLFWVWETGWINNPLGRRYG